MRSYKVLYALEMDGRKISVEESRILIDLYSFNCVSFCVWFDNHNHNYQSDEIEKVSTGFDVFFYMCIWWCHFKTSAVPKNISSIFLFFFSHLFISSYLFLSWPSKSIFSNIFILEYLSISNIFLETEKSESVGHSIIIIKLPPAQCLPGCFLLLFKYFGSMHWKYFGIHWTKANKFFHFAKCFLNFLYFKNRTVYRFENWKQFGRLWHNF